MSYKRDKPEHENSFDEEEGFKRSKTTTRTPPKDNKGEQEKQEMEEIKKMLSEMNKEIKTQIKELKTEIKDENKAIRNDIKEVKEEIKQNNEEIKNIKQGIENMKKEWAKEKKELKQENEMIKAENKKIIEDLNDLKRSIERLDKEKRKNNIIISGLTIDTEDPIALKEGMTNMLETHLGIKTDIKRTQKIGSETCLIELGSEEEKVNILRNKNKLKNVKPEKIWISEDLTKREHQKVKALREIGREMREKGKKVKMGYNKVTVDGKEWRWNHEKEKVVEIAPPKN